MFPSRETSTLNIRFLEKKDAQEIGKIYEKFHSDMEFPDFFHKFNVVYVITDSNDEIVAVGGLKPITEAIVVTNKYASTRMRRDALLQLYSALDYSAAKLEYDEIHAFSFDEEYTKHLVNKAGFTLREEKVLTIAVGKYNGKKETA